MSSQAWDWFGQHMMRHFLSSLAWKTWSTQVRLHFVSPLAWDDQHKYILCPSWHERGFVNTSRHTVYALAGFRGVWSTQVKIHFMSSLACEMFGQHTLRY